MNKLLIFTDLDATLIDHQTYSYAPALPALNLLKKLACPVIFNSSKTIAEQQQLRAELNIQDPFIVENGAAVVIPSGILNRPANATADEIQIFGIPYSEIVTYLAEVRQQQGYRFRGFADFTAAQIAQITGLSLPGATAAKQRLGTEPLVWEDEEALFPGFVQTIATKNLQATRGGRFHHVMSHTDKGQALNWLVDRYRKELPQIDWTVVALGDSPNDLEMLRVADIGVLIPNPHRAAFEVTGVKNLMSPKLPGPAGWSEAVQAIVELTIPS